MMRIQQHAQASIYHAKMLKPLHLLGLVSKRQVDGDDVTLLDEILHLSKLAAQLLLCLVIQVLVVKVQQLLQLKWLHEPASKQTMSAEGLQRVGMLLT